MNKTKKRIRFLACIAMLSAMQVVLSRFLSIQTPVVKIGFGFVPVMFAGALYGAGGGALAGALSDVVGALLFPSGSYFPGYTLTAALSGAVFLYFYEGSYGEEYYLEEYGEGFFSNFYGMIDACKWLGIILIVVGVVVWLIGRKMEGPKLKELQAARKRELDDMIRQIHGAVPGETKELN